MYDINNTRKSNNYRETMQTRSIRKKWNNTIAIGNK